jgi:hypothetical protein
MNKVRQIIAREILFGRIPRAYEIWRTYQIAFGEKEVA